jgi:DNA-binding CsgD family transcriptional regulator/RecA/RadA recombinase
MNVDDVVRPVGRDEVISALAAVARGAATPPAVLIVGEAGMGKTTLLHHVVAHTEHGAIVLSTAGASRSPLPVRVSTLLWPLRGYSADLPRPLRDALQEVFDGGATAVAAPHLLADAMVALFDAARCPVLLIVDDIDRVDDDARDLLLSVAAQLTGTKARALLTARRRDILGGIARSITTFDIGPLSAAASAELLDAQLNQPDRSMRGELIRWARGNPLALLEYARAYARSRTRTFHGSTMTGSGDAHHPVFVDQLAALPADTRKLLLVAAAATGDETIDAINQAAGHVHDFTAWQPARAAGIVEFTDARHVVFANAILRSIAYADGDLGAQRSAHRALAAISGISADVRAWHLAAAAPEPDEAIAAALEESADSSAQVGTELELARRLQRAAEMSPQHRDAARRYARAASAANFGGDPGWALALTVGSLIESGEPDVVGFAALTRASVQLQYGRPAEAFETIRTTLEGGRPPEAHLRLALLYAAAGASFYTGQLDHRRDLLRWLHLTPNPTVASQFSLPFPIAVASLQRAYVTMYTDTSASPSARPDSFDRAWLRPLPDAAANTARQLIAGVMAYSTEHTAIAATELGNAIDDVTELSRLRGFTFALAPLSWALLDTGRWAELDRLLTAAGSVSAVHEFVLVDREIASCAAQLHAFRGDVAAASVALARANATPSGASPPAKATEVALMRASGWMAVATGDFEEAYRRFRATFLGNAEPAHFVVSYRAVAELAWAAARSGHAEEAEPLIAKIGRRVMVKPPTRIRLLQHQALALVTVGHRAEQHYKLAVFDPAGEQWPLDRARARLHYGEWLRRARRPTEARMLLSAALEVFDRLGATPLADIARNELRAAGVLSADTQPHDALQALTAQERQIVEMAASGRTNREIAERLRISPRTVASHLYHVYPKLGVTRRHELREFTS